MKLVRSISVFFASVLFCSAAQAHDLVTLGDFPKWFQDAMKREVKLDDTTRLQIEQFKVDGKVLGKARLADEGDSYWYYVIDIGTDSPIECYVFTDFDGPANSLHSIVTHSLANAEKINKKQWLRRLTTWLM